MKRDAKKICHKKAPEKLVSLFIECNKNYHTLSKRIDVNIRYVYDVLHRGKYPTSKTIKGKEARRKLFIDKPKIDKPQYIKDWSHLPTEERHKAIWQYMDYKKRKAEHEKISIEVAKKLYK